MLIDLAKNSPINKIINLAATSGDASVTFSSSPPYVHESSFCNFSHNNYVNKWKRLLAAVLNVDCAGLLALGLGCDDMELQLKI